MTTKFTFVAIVLPLAALMWVAGCDGASSVEPLESPISGTWRRVDEVPGSGETWAVSVSDTTIVVAGAWTGEACCQGNLTGRGVARGDSIHLDLQYFDGQATTGTPRFTTHVDAPRPSNDEIIGTATTNGFSGTIHLQRVMLVDAGAGG